MATRTIANTGGNWSATGTWVEGVVPTNADDVVATVTSGNLTIDTAASCRSIDLTNYVGTLTHNAAITLSIGTNTAGTGNVALKFVVGMTYALGNASTSAISFVSTSSTTQTITSGGKTFGSLTINGTGSSYQLADGNTLSTTATLTLTAGTLDTNGQTCSWGLFSSSNSNTRTLTLGASAITMTGTGTVWNAPTTGGLTFNANTSTITFTGVSGGLNVGTNAHTFNNLVFSGSGNAFATESGSSTITCANCTRTGTAVKSDSFSLQGNLTVAGTLTLNGNSAVNRLLIPSGTIGTPRTMTAATVSVSNADFRDITGAGAGSWNLSAITGGSGDCGGNSGITFTTSATQTWSGASGGNWSANAWTSRVPLPQDDVVINAAFSASQTITADMPRLGRNIDFTGATGTPTLSYGTTGTDFYGSLTYISGMAISGTFATRPSGRSSYTITTAGKTLTQALTFQAAGGTYTLQDNLLTTTLTLNNGTVNANGFNVTCDTFVCNSGLTRAVILGSGTWSLTNTTTTTVWNASGTAFTITSTGSTIAISTTSTNTRTFAGGGLTYGTLTYTVAGSTGALAITGANTFNTINFSDATNARTLTLPASTANTITNAFNVQGTSGKLMTVNSSSSGTAATLSKTGGSVSCDYLSLKDSTATGGAAWYAGANSTNVSGNSGWLFAALPAPPEGTSMLLGMG